MCVCVRIPFQYCYYTFRGTLSGKTSHTYDRYGIPTFPSVHYIPVEDKHPTTGVRTIELIHTGNCTAVVTRVILMYNPCAQ